jgi:hypothetical protein
MVALARVRTVFSGVAGSPYYNNLYFSGVATTADADAVIDNVAGAWGTLASVMNIGLIGEVEAEVPLIEDTTGVISDVLTGSAEVIDPTGPTDPIPPSSQGLVRLLTSTFVRGRRLRGRIFVPGLLEANSASGRPDANAIAFLQAFGDALITPNTFPLRIWSRPVPADPEATPPTPALPGSSGPVTSITVWDQWAVLRSRRD